MTQTQPPAASESLLGFNSPLREWFSQSFERPTEAQRLAWPRIADRANTLLLAPTGSGKTLAAFLVAIDRIMFRTSPPPGGVQVLYVSPLKALGVDVERNLRAPLAGVRAVAERNGVQHHRATVAIRSGDTPAADRYRLTRDPPDILITTPESLFLLLTSRARETLAQVETVIVDEIHSLAASKRGAHLFLSLERLEQLRRDNNPQAAPVQRIGLSATQRPLEEIACLLGGAEATHYEEDAPRARPVEIVEAGRSKRLDLRIEVPVEDLASLGQPQPQSGPAAAGPSLPSIWPSIHPRLVELVRSHRSTMIFVNSRRLAERLASSINETAEEEIALAHHGSIARDTRVAIEDRLKRGELPAIVATSSLELGIDMGSVDLVVQIEAPPSIASGIQRIGRAGHHVGARSAGAIFPKHRGDLLACSAAAPRMLRGEVEETFYPRNPLDVLAQQIVAMVALAPRSVDQIYTIARRAAPFHQLKRSSLDAVLDLLAGRYPSHEFSQLRPRVNWDRITGEVAPRRGTQRLAILNAGTIPDRGLYGVFLADEQGGGSRVGELDEEMVFETRVGEVFLLGASSWQVVEITRDRVLVVPAPGQPGRMPFWRGDGPGRPLEFGRAIGQLARQLVRLAPEEAEQRLRQQHGLDELAARNLVNYLRDQAAATEEVPSDKTIVVESFLDEVGDWRVCILSPFGARIHAPWAMTVAARLRRETAGEVDMMWADDGIVLRLPESDQPPPLELLLPQAEDVEQELIAELGTTALFAARFRENAARALLLPRRQPGRRTPLWLQRRRSADLLSVASRYSSFPIILETYRECLRDVFDLGGLKTVLREVQARSIRIKSAETSTASPFASSLLFNYVGNFIYNGDAPLAERRAAALALDHAQLRELLGDAELSELLDANVIDQVALQLQRLTFSHVYQDADALHDLLLQLGDLSLDEIQLRVAAPRDAEGSAEGDAVEPAVVQQWIEQLLVAGRVYVARIASQQRLIAAEDAARYRDAVGVVPPPGLPDAFLEVVEDPLSDLLLRYGRTHPPFTTQQVAQRFGLGAAPVRAALERLAARGRVLEGEFLPGHPGRQWCDTEVLRTLKRKSLAKLRQQIEPVAQPALARFLANWHGLDRPRRGLDGLLDVIEQLQGLPLPAADLENRILPARLTSYRSSDLDELCAAGEVAWRGCGSLSASDGRIALYLSDHLVNLAPASQIAEHELAGPIRELLARQGALFFDSIQRSLDCFANDALDAIWQMVWAGELTNDTLTPLRSLQQQRKKGSRSSSRRRRGRAFRSRRSTRLPGSEGRWSLLLGQVSSGPNATERRTMLATQLLERYGVLTREMVASEAVTGGFAGLYPVLKAMEESGHVRRGYFIAGLGAAQFAIPGADDRLREAGTSDEQRTAPLVLAATDPANPYGSALAWPASQSDETPRCACAAAAQVILHQGRLVGYVSRSGQHLLTFLPDAEPDRSNTLNALATALAALASATRCVLLSKIDGKTATSSPIVQHLQRAGFVATSRGLLHRRVPPSPQDA